MCVHLQLNSIYGLSLAMSCIYLCIYFDATGHLLIIYFAFVKYLRERERGGGGEYNEAVHQLCIDFKQVYNSFRRKVLYNILIAFGIPTKLVRLIKMCLTETYSRIRVGKNLYDLFPIRNGLKQGDARSIVSAFRFCFRVRH